MRKVPAPLLALLAAAPALVQPALAQSALAQTVPAPAPAPAARPAGPPLLPAREASVLYQVAGSGRPVVEVRVTTRANGAALRVDLPDRSYMLVNQAEKRMAMVVTDEQMVMDLPFGPGPQDQFLLNSRMKFSRRGVETVAANRCINWDVTLDGGRGTVCVTEDGVLLRSLMTSAEGRRSGIEAISVSYAPASASDYDPPPDYDHMAAPAQ